MTETFLEGKIARCFDLLDRNSDGALSREDCVALARAAAEASRFAAGSADAVQTATETLTGHPGHTEGPATWTPHITIAYSIAKQPAAPLIEALGPSLPARELTLDSVSLVIQHGPERLWNWQHIGSALLLGETDPF